MKHYWSELFLSKEFSRLELSMPNFQCRHDFQTKKQESGTTPVPTWRPKRENCTPPAIEQFPRPLMGPSARKHGGLIIHIIVAVYAFIALAIVCDDYFVSSLDRICEGSFNFLISTKSGRYFLTFG